MRISFSYLFVLLCTLGCFTSALGQDSISASKSLLDLPDRFFLGLKKKAEKIESRLIRKTEKYLAALEKKEKKLRDRLSKTDSIKARELFGNTEQQYSQLLSKLKNTSVGSIDLPYAGHLDSITSALSFLRKAPDFLDRPEVNAALAKYKEVHQKIGEASNIRKLLKERQQYISSKLANSPLAKEFNKYKKELYYYKAQVEEYRNLLNDPSAMERKALQLINKIPAFKEFFIKNSMIASLFQVPADYGSTASLQGLQTRSGVQQLIQQRIAAGGTGAQALVSQNIQQAQSQFTQLKEKIAKLGGSGSDEDLPDFKPNTQKTKSFFDRLELGTNIQSTKSTLYFPTTTDLGLSLGYKINNNSIIGIGGSYKVGLGKDWNHIAITHQGIGIRSFVDVKLKGSIWISGGGELNYRSTFRDLSILYNFSNWQNSALLGITKKYRVSKKIKGSMQLMYDFLHGQQLPKTQPLVFRFGYNLK